jgi:hypothetical protein
MCNMLYIIVILTCVLLLTILSPSKKKEFYDTNVCASLQEEYTTYVQEIKALQTEYGNKINKLLTKFNNVCKDYPALS